MTGHLYRIGPLHLFGGGTDVGLSMLDAKAGYFPSTRMSFEDAAILIDTLGDMLDEAEEGGHFEYPAAIYMNEHSAGKEPLTREMVHAHVDAWFDEREALTPPAPTPKPARVRARPVQPAAQKPARVRTRKKA